jgi:SAM-dependent methyltransferase
LQLGFVPSSFKGRRIVEVGPGSGHNSLYTASLDPADYLLVEGNPTGIKDIEGVFSPHPELRSKVRIQGTSLEAFSKATLETFDLVLCENVLGGISRPKEAVRQLEKLVAPGGLLRITCLDPISTFPEVVRRFLAYLVLDQGQSIEDRVQRLMPVLSPYLDRLKGMTRRYDDWIIDNILLPLSGGYVCLSIPEAIECVSEVLDIYSSAPSFIDDWRWYKDICGEGRDFARNAIDEYWINAHSLMDYRHRYAPRGREDNERLSTACDAFRSKVLQFEKDWDVSVVGEMQGLLERVINEASTFSPYIAGALLEAQEVMSNVSADPSVLGKAEKFGDLCGRTQQHVSFFRR